MRIAILAFLLLLPFLKVKGQSLKEADSLFATGNYTKAINVYAKLGSPNAGLQIARAYNAKGNFQKAITQYESVVVRAEMQISKFELGKLYLKTKQLDKARKLFTTLAANHPSNPEYHYYLGEAFRTLDQIPSSLVAYKKAIAKDSTHLRSLFQLSKLFVVSQENLMALPYIDMGLKFYPRN